MTLTRMLKKEVTNLDLLKSAIPYLVHFTCNICFDLIGHCEYFGFGSTNLD